MFSALSSDKHYSRLSSNLELMFARAGEVNDRFINLSSHKEVIVAQAFLNYWVSKSTVPLMREVVKVASQAQNSSLNKMLVSYMEQHIEEELGHDEWCISDLGELGINRESVLAKIPSTTVASFIGSQYYWINNYHPVSFMGYLAVLEVRHPTTSYVEQLITNSGLPEKAFSSLKHHAEVDVHHKEDIINTINSLPLNDEQYRVMELSAFQTARWVALAMEEVCNAAPVNTAKVA